MAHGFGTRPQPLHPGVWGVWARTRKRKDGRTEWIPPPNLDTGQARVNNYHHPESYLIPDNKGDTTTTTIPSQPPLLAEVNLDAASRS